MRAVEDRAEDRECRAAQQVLLTAAVVLLLLAKDDVGWIWLRRTRRAGRTRGRDRWERCAAVDDLVPHCRRERAVEQRRETERERDHARERAEVEVRPEHGVPGQVEALAPALERKHADDHEHREHRDRYEDRQHQLPLLRRPMTRLVVRGPVLIPESSIPSGPLCSTWSPRSSTISSRSAAAFSKASSLAAVFIWSSRSLMRRASSSFGSSPAAIGRPPFSYAPSTSATWRRRMPTSRIAFTTVC